MTDDEALQKLDALLQALDDDRRASIALRDAILQQTQALYSLAAAIASLMDSPDEAQELPPQPLSSAKGRISEPGTR